MPLNTRNIIRSVEKAVTRLLNACRNDGNLYSRSPKSAAQVNRTAKWLLNALRRLNEATQPTASQS